MADQMHRLNSSLSDANFNISCGMILDKLDRLDQSSINSILAHDNPQQSQIVLPDGHQFTWYFAFGSMTNPVSLYLRDLIPILSYPAVCSNYRIVFRGVRGMADIEACSGAELHGVVHLLSNEQMTRLDEIESMCQRIIVNIINYEGQSHLVYAYKMATANLQESLPAERYLDVIVKGLEYHKVQSEYINRLKDEQGVIPRKQPDTFESFSDIPPNIFYTVDDLVPHNGSDPALPLWTCINGKILEYAGVPPSDHPDYNYHQRFYSFFQPLFGGREIDYSAAKTYYEPLYILPLTDNDLSDEYRAMLEDTYVNTLIKSAQLKGYWKPIGQLIRPSKTS